MPDTAELATAEFADRAVRLLHELDSMFRTLDRTGWFDDENWEYWQKAGGDEMNVKVQEFVCDFADRVWELDNGG